VTRAQMASLLTRPNLIRAAVLFVALDVVVFGVFYLANVMSIGPESARTLISIVFGSVYLPSVWAAMLVTGSDFPLIETGMFALVENLVIACTITAVWARREARYL